MSDPIWIRQNEALAIHEMMLAQYGGSDGVRDPDMLLSALDRPKNLFHYGEPDLPDLAASLAAGVVLNHPFVDGNKRTGFMLAAVFLEKNGYSFTASEVSAAQMTLGLASKEVSETEYAAWLRDNADKR